jgi:hypothetical protein
MQSLKNIANSKRSIVVISALIFSLAIPFFGYLYTGTLIASIFLIGYLAGFLLWLFVSNKASWPSIRIPYWSTLLVFLLLHKVEENRMGFFEVVGEKITGIPVPEITPFLVLTLLILPIGAWLLVPYLVRRGYEFGYYLAWTFFASTGIIELAHYVLFPFLTGEPYGYFPGMYTALPLAAFGWWGMWRLWRSA